MQTTTETSQTIKKRGGVDNNIEQKEAQLTKIKSRFGEIEVNSKQAICFTHGLLGIPGTVNFCLTDLPESESDQFRLLQCLDDHDLSFIVVPSQYDNQLLKTHDIDEACKVLDIKQENLLILFIVSVHEKGKERRLSVNAKAPVLIDVDQKTATQYVLQNSTYQIQHMIS